MTTSAVPRSQPATAGRPETVAGRVAVAVVTYNSAHDLPGLLASLPAGLRGVEWELVVADNDSADDSVAVVHRQAQEATVVAMGRNAGYAAGLNAAVRAAGPHSAVLVLNADVRLDPGCVATLLEVLERTGAGIVVPRLRNGDGRVLHSQRREPTVRRTLAAAFFGARRVGRFGMWGEIVTDPASYDQDGVTDWAEGSTQLISSDCWETVGPWDESFFLYSEETDFDLRARDTGFATWFAAAAGAVHLQGGSSTSVRLWPLVVANSVSLYRRRHGRTATAAFWVVSLLREGSRAALGRGTSRAAVAALLDPRRLAAPRGPEWLR